MKQLPLSELEGRIGYHFKTPYLLECALTHTSFANEQKIHTYKDYERLEFLGDAVLEMVSSAFLFKEYPEKREGELTKIRASLVCEPALAYCARDMGIEDYIRLGKGEELGGGREKDSIISDVCEAIIGAMYIDSGGVEKPQEFILNHILSDLEDKQLFYDAKSILQERAQQQKQAVQYKVLDESGPEHKKHFVVGVYLDERRVGTGEGRSKKAAEQQAAYHVIAKKTDSNGNVS